MIITFKFRVKLGITKSSHCWHFVYTEHGNFIEKKTFFFFFEMFQQISICYKKCNKCKICYIILNVLVLKMKTMFPQNQIHGIVLTALSFPKLFKKISIYKIMFLLQISKAFSNWFDTFSLLVPNLYKTWPFHRKSQFSWNAFSKNTSSDCKLIQLKMTLLLFKYTFFVLQ